MTYLSLQEVRRTSQSLWLNKQQAILGVMFGVQKTIEVLGGVVMRLFVRRTGAVMVVLCTQEITANLFVATH